MRCALEVPPDRGSLHVSVDPPELSADLTLRFPQLDRGMDVSVYVDTGCPVDMVASSRLRSVLRERIQPMRSSRLEWGRWFRCDVFEAEALLDKWRRIEIYAPEEGEFEDLLGLPAILRSNLCIRGDASAAFWVEMSDPTRADSWYARDADYVPAEKSTRVRPGKRVTRRATSP